MCVDQSCVLSKKAFVNGNQKRIKVMARYVLKNTNTEVAPTYLLKETS
ncbi:hypothetical protein FIV00_03330 [Labrenzia sp. THAF82]|nr:hypothetical protein FIV00_03330 [Labrenzia sp. THAF82]